MKNLKNNIFFKLGVIAVLVLLLLIPTAMVKDLIHEREYVQRSAISEVSDKWGNGQTITGPYLAIPYDRYIRKVSSKDTSETKVVKLKEWLYFLPEVLKINGKIDPDKRYRGIYEVVVYESEYEISGSFSPLDLDKFDIEYSNIHFDKATLNLGITDLKGIEKQLKLKWQNNLVAFNSGTSSTDIVRSGVNAPVDLLGRDSVAHQFSLKLDLKGSENINFIPVGKTTDVTLTSDWPTPSFSGTYLPDRREVSEAGFEANWNILHLNRNYPQSWKGAQFGVGGSEFGTDLLLPVDNYKKSYRVARYAVLFLVLTFLVFFFVEVLNKVFIHPIQYLLVGIALVVFYTLLLSFSEHIQFNYAYVVAALLTLGLITGYVMAILKSKQIAGLILGVLGIMYTFIFTIIQMEDYALLIGSIGVFAILALVMYFSRQINWYEIRLGDSDGKDA